VPTASVILLFSLLAVAVVTDLTRRKVPNWLTVPAALAGVALSGLDGAPGVIRSLEGLAAGLGAGIIFFTLFRSGGGDAKLLVAVGAIAGPSFLLWTALLGAVAGLPMALWLMWRRGTFAYTLNNLAANAVQKTLGGSEVRLDANNRAGHLPYSLAIAAGALATCLVRGL
jgi:prepilin peptidase CpaA